MFLDASAIVAILAEEPEARDLVARIETATTPIRCSALAVFEATLSLARTEAKVRGYRDRPMPTAFVDRARQDVETFLATIGACDVPVDAAMSRAALDAAKTFGRGVGHPAKLNFGDCFAYACSKSLGVPLLFKGDDFARTDVEQA